MTNRHKIALILSVMVSLNGLAQNSQVDSIFFSVRIGAYQKIPESVKQYISDKHAQIIPGLSCYDSVTVNKIHVGNFACYTKGT